MMLKIMIKILYRQKDKLLTVLIERDNKLKKGKRLLIRFKKLENSMSCKEGKNKQRNHRLERIFTDNNLVNMFLR